MSSADKINRDWHRAALQLKARDPARYLACALAMRRGDDWKTMLAALNIPDGTARGIQIQLNREHPPVRTTIYGG